VQGRSVLKILLVEDEEVDRLATSKLLQFRGYDVAAVANGAEAISRLREESFDMVLMDIRMPIMDGVKATRAIRNAEAGENARNILIIALTAYAMVEDREKCIAEGMDDYISKPVNYEELDAVIVRVCASRNSAPSH